MGYSFKKCKKSITITNAFRKILDESNHKPKKKKGIDKGNKFYDTPMKSWLEKNYIEIKENLLFMRIL